MWKRPKVSKLAKGLSINEVHKLIETSEERQRDLLRLKSERGLDNATARELEVLTSRIATMKKDLRHKQIRNAEHTLTRDGDVGGLIELKTSRLHPNANTGAELVRKALEGVIANDRWPEVQPDASAPLLLRAAFVVFEKLRKQSGDVAPKTDPVLKGIVNGDVDRMVYVATQIDTALRKLKKSSPKASKKQG